MGVGSIVLGVLMFGALVHVMCCAAVYYLNQIYQLQSDAAFAETLRFAKYFLLPVTGLFLIFFLLLTVTQISAFLKGHTPYPKWCAVSSPFFGVTGWISIGNIWMFGGLLVMMNKQEVSEIGGHILTAVSEDSLLQTVTYVGLGSVFFKGSVRNNLLMAAPDASEEELWMALSDCSIAVDTMIWIL